MNISLMDIANARLEAITYQRVQESIRTAESNARRQRLANLCAEHAYGAGFTVADFQRKDRRHLLAKSRQAFMRDAYEAGYSLTEIGDFLGGRDHTTILHGIRAASKREAGK